MKPGNLLDEITPVISNGGCVGCGACAFAAQVAVSMERDRDGVMVANIYNGSLLSSLRGGVCPMGDLAPNEDVHAIHLWAPRKIRKGLD